MVDPNVVHRQPFSSLRESVNTFSAHVFPPVHPHQYFTRLFCSFPQFVAELDVCTLLHCAVTLSNTDYVQLAAVGLNCRSHAVHAVRRLSPCLWRTMHMRQVAVQVLNHSPNFLDNLVHLQTNYHKFINITTLPKFILSTNCDLNLDNYVEIIPFMLFVNKHFFHCQCSLCY